MVVRHEFGISALGSSIGPGNANTATGDGQFAFLIASFSAPPSISQTVAFEPGIYSISFYAEEGPFQSNPLAVWLNPGTNNLTTTTTGSNDVKNVTPALNQWTEYTATITVPSTGNYTLEFLARTCP